MNETAAVRTDAAATSWHASRALVADPAMIAVYETLRRLAECRLAVLVTGETGVGKELAARALHAWSGRARGPFVAVNCAALPAELVESELFGCWRGAFSGADRDRKGFFESADGGTLFLDEVGELPRGAQAKLLRALDSGQVNRLGDSAPVAVDARVVAATNRCLATEVAAGRFREDLFYRLNAAQVLLPPLRDRPGDIPVLARALLAQAGARAGRPALRPSDATLALLARHRFAGNVRELGNAMEYAAAIAAVDLVEPWHLPRALLDQDSAPAPVVPPPASEPARAFRPIDDEIADLEKRRMTEALRAAGGNQSRAADLIGMPRRTFVTKVGRYELRHIERNDRPRNP